jgi:hypothetical protein
MKKKISYILIIIGVLLLSLIAYAAFYVNDYYKATNNVNNYLKSNEEVKVSKKDGLYIFDGNGEKDAIVFYQGGKVDNISYAPLLFKLAEKGVDCYLVDMPFRLAILGKNKASNVIEQYKYDNWYIMGHSLGGTTAAMYASSNSNKLKGLILLAAYSTNKIDEKIKVLSIYGSLDGVLNMDKYDSNKSNLVNLNEVVIDGGNHSYFGYYGEQKGDNKASITREKQQDETIIEIIDFINE